MLGTDGHSVGDAVQQIELLNTDGINFVEAVHHGDVASDPSVPRRRVYLSRTHLRLFASRTSIMSSTVASHRILISAELILYSFMTALISS